MTWKHFTREEMACRCGCGRCEMDDDFMRLLDTARDIAGIPFVITSGYRCPEHDQAVGGAGNHTQGRAADIRTADSEERMAIVRTLLGIRIPSMRGDGVFLGVNRIGIGRDFIHVDTCIDRPQNMMWLY